VDVLYSHLAVGQRVVERARHVGGKTGGVRRVVEL
jgi:hypothetical protein